MPVSSESQRLSGDQESSKNGPEIILRHKWWLIAPSLVSTPNIVTDVKLDTVKISVQSFEFELYLRRVEFSAVCLCEQQSQEIMNLINSGRHSSKLFQAGLLTLLNKTIFKNI